MTNEKLFEAIGDIKEEHILEAKQPKEKKPLSWVKICAIAACMCVVVGIASLSGIFWFPPGSGANGSNGGCGFDSGSELLASHRDDINPEIDSAVLAQFENPDEVLKAYWIITNHWFLAENIEDFSQVVTTDIVYVSPGDDEGNDKEIAYTVYSIDEQGKLDFGYSAYPYNDAIVPNTFWKLSYEVIDTALKDIDYEDYVITKCSRSGTVFVWVRCESEDLFLTYPARPDLTGFEVGGIYTLEEVQEILTKAFEH